MGTREPRHATPTPADVPPAGYRPSPDHLPALLPEQSPRFQPPGPQVLRQKVWMGAGTLAMFAVVSVVFYAWAPSHNVSQSAAGLPVSRATVPSVPAAPPSNTSGFSMPNPCALLSLPAIAAVIAEPVAAGTPADAGNGCHWTTTGGDGNGVELDLTPDVGIARATPGPGQPPVTGVGEFAYFDATQGDRLVFTKAGVEYVLALTDPLAGAGPRRNAEKQLATAVAKGAGAR